MIEETYLSKPVNITNKLIERFNLHEEKIAKSLASHYGLKFEENPSYKTIEHNTLQKYRAIVENQLIAPIDNKKNLSFACYTIDQIKYLNMHQQIHQISLNITISTQTSVAIITNKLISKWIYDQFIPSNKMPIDYSIKDLIDHIITDAIIKKSSDIHIQPTYENVMLRFRVDGELRTIAILSIQHHQLIISRLKVITNIDISERRKPQDGRFNFISHFNHERECRINICPGHYGEKCVIRILDSSTSTLSFNKLLQCKNDMKVILRSIKKPQGLILITGPTGSGKTQTLYTLLNQIDSQKKNIITIENPIEIILPNTHQINIMNNIGLTFNETLKATLRQDPDVIMIGEIRDRETAETAIHASQTGHLVLSTLHSNNTIETITRLLNMGIKPYNLTNSLLLIMAQRLIKKRCGLCKLMVTSKTENLFSKKYSCHKNTHNCPYCIDGFTGRLLVYEILEAIDTVKHILNDSMPQNKLTLYFKENEIPTLWESGISLVKKGLSTYDELIKSVPSPDEGT